MLEENIEILLVEDNPADVILTLRALQKKVANQIHVVRDGAEALDFLFCQGVYSGRNPSTPKVVLLDMKLPKVNGLEVLRQIRSDDRTKLLPVIMLTSSKEQEDIIASYKLHINSYIQKPVDFKQFEETVTQLGLYWMVVNQVPLQQR